MSDAPKKSLSIKNLKLQLDYLVDTSQHYAVIAFLVLVVGIYAFVFLKINTLSNSQPSQDAINGQVKAAKVPHIDPTVLQQLQSLQDNSVNVQTLFDQARNNPFQE